MKLYETGATQRPTLSLRYNQIAVAQPVTHLSSTLSRRELQRIVADMVD